MGYADYQGPCFIFISANGGWDPVQLCDPKGATSLEDPRRLSNYLEGDILSAGNIRFAPTGGNQVFFEKHYERVTVINGIDTQTNGHDSGSRYVFSGRLGEGYPSLAAMVAAAYDPGSPMAFLSFGGYDETNGHVARTRAGNVSALSRLAFPERSDPNNPESTHHSAATLERLAAVRAARDADLLGSSTLPREGRSMNTLFTARTGSNELALLQSFLPEDLDNTNNPLKRQSQLVLAAYRAGICISANLALGGFDTHGNHDTQQQNALQRLLEGVDFLWEEAVRQNVSERIVVVVGSDFGRTPQYNDQRGKDHWAITSMMLLGAGIPGNRVVGQTDEGHVPIEVDPLTLDPGAGLRIEPVHIHRSLRQLAKINGSDLDALYPLDGVDLPILG
jgi:hypothetical protein